MFKNIWRPLKLKQLLTKYKLNDFIIYFSITLISCLLIQYSVVYPLISFIFLFIYSLFNFKKRIIIFSIVSVLFISFLVNYLLLHIDQEANITNKTFRIETIKNNYLVVTRNFHKYYVSGYDLDQSQLVLNRHLKVSGYLTSLDSLNSNNNYEFNFKDHLNKTGVKYQLKIGEVSYLNNGLFYKINKFYLKIFDHELSRIFIMNNRNNSEVIKHANSLSLSYLFNFGGLPIFLIGYLLQKGLKLLRIKVKAISISLIVIDALLLLFCLTINLPFLITKTFLFLIVKNIFRYKRIAINKVKLWIICFTLLIAIHNEVFLNKTFYYYLVAIIFLKQPKTKVMYKRVLYNLLLCSLTFMVVNIMVDYRFYYFNELFDLLLIPMFSLEAIFVYLTWWIPHIDVCYDFLLKINNAELTFLKEINFFYSNGHIPIYIFWIYFLSLYSLIVNLHNKKINWVFGLIMIVSLVMMFVYKYVDHSINNKFILLDVGNGQTLVWHSKKETILFDVGVGKGYSNNKIVSFLKYYGINKIDKVFISHYHLDHYSGLESILNNEIKVNEVIKREEVDPLIKTKDLLIEVFKNDYLDKNENNNSLAYLVKWNNKSLLIMSDLEIKGEKELINSERFLGLVNGQTIDYMIAGHHGSKTATSEELLKLVNPKQVLISGHDNSNRHFPDLETINKLQDLNIEYLVTEKENDLIF